MRLDLYNQLPLPSRISNTTAAASAMVTRLRLRESIARAVCAARSISVSRRFAWTDSR
jgi:hypothetical protein